MEIDNSIGDLIPSIARVKPKKGRKLADLLKDLQPKLDAILPNSRVPSAPPSSVDLAAVGDEFEKAFGIKRAVAPPTTVDFGNMIIHSSGIGEVCIGLDDGIPILAFLYLFHGSAEIKTCVMSVDDGKDPMMAGKALKWGVAPSFAPAILKTYPESKFFQLTPYTPVGLANFPVLAARWTVLAAALQAHYYGQSQIDKDQIKRLEYQLKDEEKSKSYAVGVAVGYRKDNAFLKTMLTLFIILCVGMVIVTAWVHR